MRFLLLSTSPGILIGLGWHDLSMGWLGVIGMGLFILAQLVYQTLLARSGAAAISGYVSFVIATPWMNWTVGGLIDTSTVQTLAIVHAIHLFNGGIFVLFAITLWAFSRWVRHGFWLTPAIWLCCEAIYPLLLPMRQGCLLLEFPCLFQIASIFGIAGVTLQTFLIASLVPLVTILLIPNYNWGIRRSHTLAGVTVVVSLTLVNALCGSLRMQQMAEIDRQVPTLPITIVQGDTEHAQFHIGFMDRTRKHAARSTLVLWPECSIGNYSQLLKDFSDASKVADMAVGVGSQFQPLPNPGCYLLAAGYSWTAEGSRGPAVTNKWGVTRRPPWQLDKKFVSAFLIDPDQQLVGRHDKQALMPGGEYSPGEKWCPPLARWLDSISSGTTEDGDREPHDIALSRGESSQPIGSVDGLALGVVLCCEDMVPRLSRQLVHDGADVLVTLANGMSFNSEVALKQHLGISQLRSVENNRYFIRCGSNGISCLVSPAGVIVDSLPSFCDAELQVEIPIQKRESTWYAFVGNGLSRGCFLLLGLVFVVAASLDRRRLAPEKLEK